MDRAKTLSVISWLARGIASAIFVIGALPKFTGGAELLAERIPGGTVAVLAIGAIELIAVLLMLVPRTARVGSALAGAVMLGAISSHFGPVGFEGDFAFMFGLAVTALAAAGTAYVTLLMRQRSLPTS